MSRNSRYFPGMGLAGASVETGKFLWDPERKKFIKYSDAIPKVSSQTLIEGEIVHCSPNGEVLELDNMGPVRVSDANEKAAYLKRTGFMPAPGRSLGHWGGPTSRPNGPKTMKKTLEQQFFQDHGYGLKDHMRDNYPKGAEVTLDMNNGGTDAKCKTD